MRGINNATNSTTISCVSSSLPPPRAASPTVLLILLSAAVFLTLVSVLMLGPLLVGLAHEFQTSVALVGQLVAATAITWGITAPLAGPVSDTYGRRQMLLTGLLLMTCG